MSDEFISFDQALDELRLKEDELKKLVSEGEIRAFRKGETMKLRQSDVDALRRELGGPDEAVVDMGGADEELVFEDEDLDGDGGMATQEMEVDMDTLLEEDVEDLGDLELDEAEEDEDEIEEAVPVAAAVEEEEMHPGLMAAVLASVAIMIFFVPVALALSKGRVSGGAKLVGGFMGKKFDHAPAIQAPAEPGDANG